MQAPLDKLTSGDPTNLRQALKDDTQKQQLCAVLESDPQAFLKSIENVHDAASIVAALTNAENASVLASVCRETILSAGTDCALYVHVFMNLTKYDVPDVASTLVGLLSSQYSEPATLCLATWVKRTDGHELSACVQEMCHSGRNFGAVAAALETFLPLVPALVPVYTSPECKKMLLERAACMQDTQALLRLVSASCVYETARKFNKENYLSLLIQGARGASQGKAGESDHSAEDEFAEDESAEARQRQQDSVQALSLLCIVKLWNFSAVEMHIPLSEILSRLRAIFLMPVHQAHQYVLEAFTYLSLGMSTRQQLRSDEEFTDQLVLVMETTTEPAALYASLLTLANLTRIPESSAAAAIKSAATKEEESVSDIQAYNSALVFKHKLVQTLCALRLQPKDLNLARQRVVVLHNITAMQSTSVSREAVVQGGLPVLLQYLIEAHVRSKAASSSPTDVDLEAARSCTRALANLCRSADPRLAFSKYDVKTCVPFLASLLKNPEDPAQSPAQSLIDKLHGLLALTNVSSLPDADLHAQIIAKTGDLLPDMFLDSVPEIQKAAWELVNNVITHPNMLAKFFNTDNARSRKNLDILVKLLHSKDPALQVIISGILANSTMEYVLVCRCLLDHQRQQLLGIVCDILHHQSDNSDLLLRVVTLLYNLNIADEKSASGFFDSCLVSHLRRVMKSSRNSDVVDMINEILADK